MGNSQSHPNKLSKPKTNTNSPFVSPKVGKIDSPASLSSKYTELVVEKSGQGADGYQNPNIILTSPVDTAFTFNSDEDDQIGELAGHLQRRLSTVSRSNSLRSPTSSTHPSTARLASLPGSKTSLVSDTLTVDLETAIKILQEVRKTASPEDLAALHKALQPSGRTSSPSPSQKLHRRLSAANSSTHSLIRRRSLATPGVATRGSPSEPARKSWAQWNPSLPAPKDEEWRIDMMGTSPLTKLAALDLAEEGRDSPTPRARTPGDMEYSLLGSLKAGSLFVTNGAPSPAPSVLSNLAARRNSISDIPQEEDYFTASEGCSSPVPWTTPSRRPRRHGRSKSSIVPNTYLRRKAVRDSSPSRREDTVFRCDSPLKLEAAEEGVSDSELRCESVKHRLRVINKSADTLATFYKAEIPSNPFINEEDKSQKSVLGCDDEAQVDDTLSDALSYREEAFRILDGTIFSDHSPSAGDQYRTQNTNSPESFRRPAPSKADSGYSSGGSFRAVESPKAKFRESIDHLTSKKSNGLIGWQIEGRDDSVSLYTFEEMLSLPISRPLPPVPTHENAMGKPAHLQAQGSLSSHLQPSSAPPTPRTVASQKSIESKMSIPKKLQKRRPSSQALPVVQTCQPIAEGSIPDIPSQVRAKFTRRLSEAPGMEYLTHTFASTSDTDAKVSLSDSPVITSSPQCPPASPSSLSRPRHHRRAQTERPPTPPSHSLRHSLSFFRSRTSEEKRKNQSNSPGEEEDAKVSIADLGTVAHTLGHSPYDVAMATVPVRAIAAPTHPHQLGSALPRARSMVNMDAKMAAELARMRSKDRASLRPSMPPRPRSYCDVNQEAGKSDGARWRPHAEHMDIPPLPTIDRKRISEMCGSFPRVWEDVTVPATKTLTPIRAKAKGRGIVVSQLIDRYDKWNQQSGGGGEAVERDPTGRLWSQRRKSMAEGLRDRARLSQTAERAASQPPEETVPDRYRRGLEYRYESGFGVSGSASVRQTSGGAQRESMQQLSQQFGVDLSDIPVMVARR